jgi:hypothetical protein
VGNGKGKREYHTVTPQATPGVPAKVDKKKMIILGDRIDYD